MPQCIEDIETISRILLNTYHQCRSVFKPDGIKLLSCVMLSCVLKLEVM